MQQTKIRQEDIAKAACVSVSTVSRVFSGSPGISESTRSRVFEVAADLGGGTVFDPGIYVASAAMRLKRALLFLNEGYSYPGTGEIYPVIVSGLRKAAAKVCLPIEFAMMGGNGEIPQELLQGDGTGVLFVGVDPGESLINQLLDNGNPTVLVNGLDTTMRLDHVAPNNLFGGMLAARHLIEKGHKSILQLGTDFRWTLRTRSEGFRLGIQMYGNDQVHCDSIMMPGFKESHARAAFKSAVSSEKFPYDAVFCSADNLALTIMQELRLRGLKVPEDVSVLGFNGSPIAELSSPPLSTLRINWENIGSEAIRLLLRRAQDPDAPTQQSLFDAKLIERSSVNLIA